MEYLNNYEQFKESFLSNLKDNILNNISRSIGGGVKKIDNILSKYEKQMLELLSQSEEALKKLSDADVSEKTKAIRLIRAQDKKKRTLERNLTSELEKETKDSDRKRAYASFSKNQVELKLLDKEIELLSSTDSDDFDDLIEEREKDIKKSKENVEKSKDFLNKITKEEPEDSEEPKELSVGDMLKYKTSDGDVIEREIVDIKTDGFDVKTQGGGVVFINKRNVVE